jgi:hypothetical protein
MFTLPESLAGSFKAGALVHSARVFCGQDGKPALTPSLLEGFSQ